MEKLMWILGSTIVVSLISLVGIFTISLRDKWLKKVLLVMVAFSAGSLMGGAFLHLLPEAIEKVDIIIVMETVVIGFSVFFLIERILHWRHCHDGHCTVHTFTYMNLIGDAVHNFIDGVIIAISFFVNVPFGIITTVAIIAHEIPQEMSDFGVLVYGGFSRIKALVFNFFVALTAIMGAIAGYLLYDTMGNIIPYVLPFAAGGFIYIAASDLVPEIHKEPDLTKSMMSFSVFVLGIFFMWFIKYVFGG